MNLRLRNVIAVGRQSEIQELAQHYSEKVFAADDISEAEDIIRRVCPELILFDYRFGQDGLAGLSRIIENNTDTHIVAVGNDDNNTQPSAGFAERENCYYLNDENDHHGLCQIVSRIKRESRSAVCGDDTGTFFANDLALSTSIVGMSASIIHILKMIAIVAASMCNPILIVGEMGTGKELAARAIHVKRCPERPFVAVNCASLSTNLLESELFGHEKGAFTSADREKTGLLELAEDGCIFLDEISEMPPELQAKLLRVIQEKTFRRVGGTKEIACKATIIASSNRNLKSEVQANRFRGDLYHRLTIFPICLSPLRSPGRREDIRLLASYFLKTSTICPDKANYIQSITQVALEALEAHSWPGNVRELRNVIERAILLETTDKIGLNSIIINPEEPEEFFSNDSGEKIKTYSLAKAEQELIARVLQETNGQKTKAAELLGISRATLYAKVKQHNLQNLPEEQDSESISTMPGSFSKSAAVA